MTLMDQKTFNFIVGTSHAQCPFCRAMGENLWSANLDQVNSDLYGHGLSTLHGLLRGFDFFLQLAYQDSSERKKIIQDKFKQRLNLLIDIPIIGGGNTNTGNTARKFFHNISSEIAGIPDYNNETARL